MKAKTFLQKETDFRCFFSSVVIDDNDAVVILVDGDASRNRGGGSLNSLPNVLCGGMVTLPVCLWVSTLLKQEFVKSIKKKLSDYDISKISIFLFQKH